MSKLPFTIAQRTLAQLTAAIRTRETEYVRVGEAIVTLGQQREDLEARLCQLYEAKRDAEAVLLRERARYEGSPAYAENARRRRAYHQRKAQPVLTLTPEPEPTGPMDPYTLYRQEKDRRKKRAAA